MISNPDTSQVLIKIYIISDNMDLYRSSGNLKNTARPVNLSKLIPRSNLAPREKARLKQPRPKGESPPDM